MTHPRASLTVLVAEDDPDDRLLIREALQEELRIAGDLRFVGDGEELLDYLHGRGRYAEPESAPPPDLIFLDLNMPRKSGAEALGEIKTDPRLKRIPVVVLTTSKRDADVARSYDLGANSFITKPATFPELVAALRVVGTYWLGTVRLPPLQGYE